LPSAKLTKEQGAATQEISGNVLRAAQGTPMVSANITDATETETASLGDSLILAPVLNATGPHPGLRLRCHHAASADFSEGFTCAP
jgi:hypothetical protein